MSRLQKTSDINQTHQWEPEWGLNLFLMFKILNSSLASEQNKQKINLTRIFHILNSHQVPQFSSVKSSKTWMPQRVMKSPFDVSCQSQSCELSGGKEAWSSSPVRSLRWDRKVAFESSIYGTWCLKTMATTPVTQETSSPHHHWLCKVVNLQTGASFQFLNFLF